jgi:putative transposase
VLRIGNLENKGESMNNTSNRHGRRSIRLQNFDYSQPGAYFVTIVAANREHLFSEFKDGIVRMNRIGESVQEEWFKTTEVRSYTRLFSDEFIAMPNQIHGIIHIIDQPVRATRRVAPTEITSGPQPDSIGAIIAQYKSIVTRRVNQLKHMKGCRLWQRNYWEHVIRNEHTLEAVRQYINQNPMCWDMDRYNTNAIGLDPQAKVLWQTLKSSIR